MKKHCHLIGGLILVGLFSGTAQALSLSDLISKTRVQIRDTSTDTTLQRYSDSYITNLINEGQRDAVNQSWCLDATTNYVLIANQKFYQLPSNLIAIKFARFIDNTSTSTYILEEKNERSFRQNNPDWEKQTGKPVQYFTRSSTFTNTTLELAVYPIPHATSDLGNMIVDYVVTADDLSSASDIPFNGQNYLLPYNDLLSDYVTAQIKVVEGRTDEATLYRNLYAAGLAVLNSKWNSKPNWTPSFGGAVK